MVLYCHRPQSYRPQSHLIAIALNRITVALNRITITLTRIVLNRHRPQSYRIALNRIVLNCPQSYRHRPQLHRIALNRTVSP